MAVILLCLLLLGAANGFHWPSSTVAVTGEMPAFQCGIDKIYNDYMFLEWFWVDKNLTLYTYEGHWVSGRETHYDPEKYYIVKQNYPLLDYYLWTFHVRNASWADGGTFKCIPMKIKDSDGAQLIVLERPTVSLNGNPTCTSAFGAPYVIESAALSPSLTLLVNGILLDFAGHQETTQGVPGVSRHTQWSVHTGITLVEGDTVQCMLSTSAPFKWLSGFEMVTSSAAVEKPKYCNKDLVQKLLTVCESVWNQNKQEIAGSELQLNNMRVKLGLHEACCLKGCTDNDILAYC